MWDMAKYLIKRRRRWYATLDIPYDLRHHYDGKPRFVKSLETESLTEAEALIGFCISKWKLEFQQARSGGIPVSSSFIPEALEWRNDLEKSSGERRDVLMDVLEEKVDALQTKNPSKATSLRMIVTGESFPTGDRAEAWLDTLANEPKTIDMKRSDLKRFAEKFPLTHQISRQAVRNWAHDLEHEGQLKQKTVARILSACRGYWSFLQRTQAIKDESEPFLHVSDTSRRKGKAAIAAERKPFTNQQISNILDAAGNDSSPQLSQLIWIAMWTGCRIEEICSLQVKNIRDGYFSVEDSKTKASSRDVPIHSRLKELFDHLLAKRNDGFLLAGLSVGNKYGQRSDAVGKKFGRLKTKLGFGPDYVFHSIRKTVATQLENAQIPESISADILGHEKPTMTYGLYSGSSDLTLKSQAIEALSYPLKGTPSFLLAE